MNRTGKTSFFQGAMLLLAFVAVVALVGWIGGFFPQSSAGGAATANVVSGTGSQQICSGVSSVAVTYNDVDRYVPGTDPGVGGLFITTDKKGLQSEGSITLTPGEEYDALAGQNATLFFAEPSPFETSCVASDLVVDVVKAGAPTITIINSDGVTKNSDANDEAAGTSSSYDVEVSVKAPTQQCSSRHGALLVADFDKTYVQKVEFSSPLIGGNVPDYLYHVDVENGTSDGFTAGQFSGELCDAAKVTIPMKVTTTSTASIEGNANVVLHWLPLNYDVDQDTYAIIGPAAEDEDNNAIIVGNTTAQFYTS